MQLPSTKTVVFSEPVPSRKTVQIKFSELSIDQDSRDQVSVNQPSAKTVEIKFSVNLPSTKTFELKSSMNQPSMTFELKS